MPPFPTSRDGGVGGLAVTGAGAGPDFHGAGGGVAAVRRGDGDGGDALGNSGDAAVCVHRGDGGMITAPRHSSVAGTLRQHCGGEGLGAADGKGAALLDGQRGILWDRQALARVNGQVLLQGHIAVHLAAVALEDDAAPVSGIIRIADTAGKDNGLDIQGKGPQAGGSRGRNSLTEGRDLGSGRWSSTEEVAATDAPAARAALSGWPVK